MDSDVVTPALAGAGALLALLGARRQRQQDQASGDPGAATVGRQVGDAGAAASVIGGDTIRRVGSASTDAAVAVGQVVVVSGTALAGGLTRTAVRTAGAVTSAGVGLAGTTVARTGGLVLDGAVAVGDLVTAPVRHALAGGGGNGRPAGKKA